MEPAANDSEHVSHLLKRLSVLQTSGKLCDVKFVCSDGIVQAHSAVLACSCHAFGTLIAMCNIVIPLDQYTVRTVQQLVTFLYTGSFSCEASEDLQSSLLLVNQLLQINANQPDLNSDPKDLLNVAKRTVEHKLCAGAKIPSANLHSDVKSKNETVSNDFVPEPLDCASETTKQTSELLQQESYIPNTNSPVKDEGNAAIAQEPKKLNDSAETENTIKPAEQAQGQLVGNVKPISVKRKKVVTRGVSESRKTVLAKAMKRKAGRLKRESSTRAKRKKTAKAAKDETDDDEENDDSVQSSDERPPDWTLHKGGDWHPDKYKKMFKRKKLDRSCPFLCVMCGHRAHDMRHHLNHLHCKHKIPYKEEDIGKWVDVCPYEGCSYAAALNIKSHIAHVHEQKTGAFTCDTCKKVFKREGSLRTHMRRVHVKPTDFKACPECDKMVSSHYLEKHIGTVHNPDHYHLCSHCHFKTKSLSGARFHMITKHNDYSLGKVTIHECKYCDYKATHVDNVQRHMTVHEIKMGLQNKNVLCDICGKAFAHRRLMESHRLWHTSKDRHKCQYCNFSAPFIRHVKQHTQRQHTQKEVRPWRCTHCAYASNDRGNLKKHLLNTHKLPEPEVVEIMKASLTSSQSQQNAYPNQS